MGCESERNCMLRYHTRAQSNIFLATMLIEGLTAWGLAYYLMIKHCLSTWGRTTPMQEKFCQHFGLCLVPERFATSNLRPEKSPGAPGLPGENHGGFSSPKGHGHGVGCSIRDRRFLKNTAHGLQVPHRSSPLSAPDIQSFRMLNMLFADAGVHQPFFAQQCRTETNRVNLRVNHSYGCRVLHWPCAMTPSILLRHGTTEHSQMKHSLQESRPCFEAVQVVLYKTPNHWEGMGHGYYCKFSAYTSYLRLS